MSEKSCSSCLYNFDYQCENEQCSDGSGWRPKDGKPITFVDKLKEALPKDKLEVAAIEKELRSFSLDKLIDDHWKYNEGLVRLCFPYGVDGWETDDILRLVEFAYKQSGKHFWKHCKEHYNIEGESDE